VTILIPALWTDLDDFKTIENQKPGDTRQSLGIQRTLLDKVVRWRLYWFWTRRKNFTQCATRECPRKK